MHQIFLSLFFITNLFASSKTETLFHKTVGQIEAYKEKGTLNLRAGCIRRLTRNLLTPIHKRTTTKRNIIEKHLLTKTSDGPITVKFLMPLSLKKEIQSLLARKKLTLSIPIPNNKTIKTAKLEIDPLANPPKGLFAMISRLETKLLSPAEVIFIHLLKDET